MIDDISLTEFMAEHAAEVQEYLPVMRADPVRKNQLVWLMGRTFNDSRELVAPAKGWLVSRLKDDGRETTKFFSDDAFDETMIVVDDAEPAIERQTLPPKATVTPSATLKGMYDVQVPGGSVPVPQSPFTLLTRFNLTLQNLRGLTIQPNFAVAAKRMPELRAGLILEEDQTLVVPYRNGQGGSIHEISQRYEAGTFIYKKDAVPGGFAIARPVVARDGLRKPYTRLG